MNYSNHKGANKPKAVKVLFFVGAAILIVLALSYIVMLLWNAILPELTGVKRINQWQSAGLLVLSKILFGNMNFGKFSKRHRSNKRRHSKEKWMTMNDAEKEDFKAKWKERCEIRKNKS